MLILADNELIQARQQTASLLLASFILEPSKGDVINKTIPSWPNSDVRDAVNYYPGSVDIINAQFLVKGDKNQPLVINRQAGLGNIALSFIHDSYQWKTLGKSLQYGQYWQYIINAIARNQSEPYWLEQNPASLVYRHQQNRSCAMSGDMDLSARQSVVHTAEQPMMLVPSILQPSLRCGFFWSDYVGWQKFTLLNHKEQPIDSQSAYVYAENAWSTWLQAKKYQASMNKTKEQVSITIKPQYKSLDRWYFWLVLFTCSSLLWIEKKVFNKT